jgi:hypothetical protein
MNTLDQKEIAKLYQIVGIFHEKEFLTFEDQHEKTQILLKLANFTSPSPVALSEAQILIEKIRNIPNK